MMRCATCGAELIPLFLSYVCDLCETRRASGDYFRGYVLWRDADWGSTAYVFRTRTDAAKYRSQTKRMNEPIRTALSLTPFRWRQSNGNVQGVELADRRYEIYPNDMHEPGPNRAFLDDPATRLPTPTPTGQATRPHG